MYFCIYFLLISIETLFFTVPHHTYWGMSHRRYTLRINVRQLLNKNSESAVPFSRPWCGEDRAFEIKREKEISIRRKRIPWLTTQPHHLPHSSTTGLSVTDFAFWFYHPRLSKIKASAHKPSTAQANKPKNMPLITKHHTILPLLYWTLH